jgi:hypothetical protein
MELGLQNFWGKFRAYDEYCYYEFEGLLGKATNLLAVSRFLFRITQSIIMVMIRMEY